MNNITYNIIDKYNNDDDDNDQMDRLINCSWTEIQISESSNNKRTQVDNNIEKETEILARKMDYDINYNIKYLIHILEFYEFKRNKLNKMDIIDKIVDFEMQNNNKNIVEDRQRLFNNFIELKNNKFFSKFIVGNL